MSATTYEDMVSALLSILHPQSVRTDGAGGDGGRDVHFDSPSGMEILELKSFTGRMTDSRWRQVRNSLNRAITGFHPSSWTVVCPIDLTNKEREKFEKLTGDAGLPCEWRGKTWLDAQMAQHPQVPRYFLSDVTNELKDLVELFHQETAALANGVPDAIDRLRALKERCDELDPFYFVDLATDSLAGSVSASLVPRYPGAERDRPISLQADLVFPDNDVARSISAEIQAAYDFGTGFEVPAEYVQGLVVDAPAGLGGEFGSGTLKAIPHDLVGVPQMELKLVITNPDGDRVASMSLSGKAKTAGASGVIASLQDSTGLIAVELKLNWVAKTVRMSYSYQTVPCLPTAMIPALTFMAAANDPNLMACELVDGSLVSAPTPISSAFDGVFEHALQIVSMLSRVQTESSTWFDTPESLTNEDLVDLAVADELLGGRVVTGTWESISFEVEAGEAAAAWRETLETTTSPPTPVSLWRVEELNLELGGHIIPLGTVSTVCHSAQLDDLSEVLQQLENLADGESVRLHFSPGKVDTLERWWGRPEERPT